MYWKIILLPAYFLTWLLIPHLLLKNRSPVSTLAWIWATVLFPFIGPLAYGLFGSDRLARRHLRKRRSLPAALADVSPRGGQDADTRHLIEACEASDRELLATLERINLFSSSTTAEAELLVDAGRFYPALIKAIDHATHHVHVQFFVFHDDQYGHQIIDALIRAQSRGVETRLLLDQFGCSDIGDELFVSYREAGGRFSWFRTIAPLRNRWVVNLRNHRKIQVIDGQTGFVGGMNIGREYAGEDPRYGSWRDVQIRLQGAGVAALQRTFAEDWFYATDEELTADCYYPVADAGQYLVQVLADGPDVRENPIQMSVVALLAHAQKRLWVTAGYFVPNEPLLTALKVAAARGVDVRLLISEKSDHPYLVQVGRSYYEELMDFGVRIFEYEKGINHAKVALCDDHWAMIGSANFDIRSMQLNFEANVLIRAEHIARELETVLRDDMEKDSDEIDLERFRQRSFRQRATESFFRPLAPLL